MRKLLSIFMSVVMLVTMLPMMSFAEEPPMQQSEKCPVGGVQDTFFQFVGLVKERAPQAWEKIKPYVEQGKNWCKDYYNNVSEFASKVQMLGLVVTAGLFVMAFKVVWKVLKFIIALFGDDEFEQAAAYRHHTLYS